METPIEKIEYRGHYIKIYYDDMAFDSETPRDWENLGKMICFHSRYDLGDKHTYNTVSDLFEDLVQEIIPEDLEEELEDDIVELLHEEFMDKYSDMIDKHYIMLPIYLYDHSGITINTSGFSCPWDSGQIGYIYMSKDDAKKEFCYSSDYENKAINFLKGEIRIYNQYLTGEVYGYMIEPKENNKKIHCNDSCWGFYGDPEEEAIPVAKDSICWAIKKYKKQVIKDTKIKQELNLFMKTCWAY